MKNNLETIGRNTLVSFKDSVQDVPAKVDTGADSSSIWATNIYVDKNHQLHFVLFGDSSPHYTGQEIITDNYSVVKVRSSSGHAQIRYRVVLSVTVVGRNVHVRFTLADRRRNIFPILIGRRTLMNRFIVDVSRSECQYNLRPKARLLNNELEKNPHEFFKKYHQNDSESDKVKK